MYEEFIKEDMRLNEADIEKIGFDICVDYEVDNIFLESTIIRPILTKEGEVDEQALAEYQDFILELLLELDSVGLTVINRYDSKSSETSKYFTLAEETQYMKNNMKYIIYLRVSDHVPNLTEREKKMIKQKRIGETEKLKVKWKVRSIIVNNTTFSTYEEAVEYVRTKVIEYKNTLE